MNYLNVKKPFLLFQKALRNPAFVDKSLLITVINHQMETSNNYICITKPRRFGKTTNANMLGAYYCRSFDSSELFHGLAVSGVKEYQKHRNQYNVIYIDFSRLPDKYKTYEDYINNIKKKLRQDLMQAYPGIISDGSLADLFDQTGDSFVFILDEWDSIFYRRFMTRENKEDYLLFLKDLLKDQAYVELAYMTGVLPITKYSSGSELNMFREYSFIDDPKFSHFFGFTESEVQELCEKFPVISFEEMKEWYDGYYTSDGKSLFNPHSVCSALNDGVCRSYWTQTGPMNEIADCIKHNVDAVKDDVIKMVSDIPVKLEEELQGYSALEQQLMNRDEILSAMVVFGFLTYWNKTLKIPNKELMLKFQTVLKSGIFGGVSEVVARSKEMLEATLEKNTKKMADILEYIHDLEIPILQYNDENSLACVVNLCYLYARDYYKLEREKKTGKGYCDFIFYPKIKGNPGIILELKCDGSCEEAIQQIKEKNYIQELQECREVLLVGINYSKQKKAHECKIEVYPLPHYSIVQEVYFTPKIQ